MNRLSKISRLVVGLLAAGLIAGAVGGPANAGSLSWKDDAGDAVTLGLADGPVNDPAFDITDVSIATAGGKLVWSATVPELVEGSPELSTGYHFRFAFTHGGTTYWFQAGNDVTGAQTFSIGPTDNTLPRMECKDCKGTINAKEKTVVIEAPLASLDAGFKAASAAPATGSEWSALYVISQRRMVAATLTADQADAPEGAVFTF